MSLSKSVEWERWDHHPGVPTHRHSHAHNPEAQRETGSEVYFWKNQIQKWIHKEKQGLVDHAILTFDKKVKHLLMEMRRNPNEPLTSPPTALFSRSIARSKQVKGTDWNPHLKVLQKTLSIWVRPIHSCLSAAIQWGFHCHFLNGIVQSVRNFSETRTRMSSSALHPVGVG